MINAATAPTTITTLSTAPARHWAASAATRSEWRAVRGSHQAMNTPTAAVTAPYPAMTTGFTSVPPSWMMITASPAAYSRVPAMATPWMATTSGARVSRPNGNRRVGPAATAVDARNDAHDRMSPMSMYAPSKMM